MPGQTRTLFAARMLLASGAVAAGLSVVALFDETPTPAGADATQTVALYNMNEAAGSTVLVDSSTSHLDGAIGSTVLAGTSGNTVHGFSQFAKDGTVRSPTGLPVEPERLDTVPHSTVLNPDTEDFAITVRYRTDKSFGNLVQKGQNASLGGYFKIELPGGRPTCLFKGVGTQGSVKPPPPPTDPALPDPYDISDNVFHTIKCERLQNRVALWIDGVEVNRKVGATGNIGNTKNLSIAGKSNCDQVETTCDYFVGEIDYVRIEKGQVPDPNVLPIASFTSSCVGLTCTFDGTGSRDPDGTIAKYSWDFGDDQTATGQKPKHTFVAGSDYEVNLVVTDNDGGESSVSKTLVFAPAPTTTTTIVAQEPPPPPARVTEVKGAATGLKVAQRLPVVTGE